MQNRRRTASLAGLGLALGLALVSCWTGAAEPYQVLFLTQPVGNLAEAMAQMAADLNAAGRLTAFGDSLPDPAPQAVVVDDERLLDEAVRGQILTFARNGGRVVLLFEPGQRHYDQANLLLGEVGAKLEGLASSPGDLRLSDHPLTLGLRFDPTPSFRAALTGENLTPLATAGKSVVMGQVRAGAGVVTVLPAALVVSALRNPGPGQPGLLLAERALAPVTTAETPAEAGANGPPPAPEEAPGGEGPRYLPALAPTALPLEERDFAGAVLYDCLAGDDNWPAIHPAAQALLTGLGLPVKALRVTAEGTPLAAALASNPRLVVLGSWRELAETEVVALYYYVLGGGRVLALGHARTSDQIRLVYLNEALYNLGLLLSLGRPAGEAKLAEGSAFPLLLENSSLGKMPTGLEVRGWAARPVLMVDTHAIMGCAEAGLGRVLALDAGPLVENAAYRAALQGGLQWLLTSKN